MKWKNPLKELPVCENPNNNKRCLAFLIDERYADVCFEKKLDDLRHQILQIKKDRQEILK